MAASTLENLPLGTRPDALLTDLELQRFSVIESYDLNLVRSHLLRSELLLPPIVDLMIFEFRRYMGMCLIRRGSVPMLSRAVDEVWHTTLLYTRLYADLSERVFGYFLHHDPATTPWPDVDARWDDFCELYYRLYGPLGAVWENARRSR